MKVKLKEVRLSFPDLWVPTPFKNQPKTEMYRATFLIEPDSANDKAIRAAIEECGTEVFKDKWEKTSKSIWGVPNKCSYLDGDTREYDGYEGVWALSAVNKARPLVLDRVPYKTDANGKPILRADGTKEPNELTPADGKPYAGCYVNATVDIWVQSGEYPGIRCSLLGVQFARDGEAFSGGQRATADDFDDLGDTGEDDDLV